MKWALCLLCVAVGLRGVHAGPIRKPSKMADKAAPQEEVNVLMFGVIQFSESINYAFETTEAKIAQIRRSLKSHEGTLQQLGKETEQAAEVEKQIKEVLGLLQVQMAKLQAQAKMTKDRLASVEQEEVQLKTKVKNLETYIDNSFSASFKELQERAEEHSNMLKSLQHFTKYQKESLESQDQQLHKLQKMREATPQLHHCGLQASYERDGSI